MRVAKTKIVSILLSRTVMSLTVSRIRSVSLTETANRAKKMCQVTFFLKVNIPKDSTCGIECV